MEAPVDNIKPRFLGGKNTFKVGLRGRKERGGGGLSIIEAIDRGVSRIFFSSFWSSLGGGFAVLWNKSQNAWRVRRRWENFSSCGNQKVQTELFCQTHYWWGGWKGREIKKEFLWHSLCLRHQKAFRTAFLKNTSKYSRNGHVAVIASLLREEHGGNRWKLSNLTEDFRKNLFKEMKTDNMGWWIDSLHSLHCIFGHKPFSSN